VVYKYHISYHTMIEQIPIEITYAPFTGEWSLIDTRLVSWEKSAGGCSKTLVTVEVPNVTTESGAPVHLTIHEDHVPPQMMEQISRFSRGFDSVDLLPTIPILWFGVKSRAKPEAVTVRQVADAFLQLKQNDGDLVDFLNKQGAWGWSFSPPFTADNSGSWKFDDALSKLGGVLRFERESDRRLDCLVPVGYFWKYKNALVERLRQAVRDPVTWFLKSTITPQFERISEYPFYRWRLVFILQAIEIAYSMEFMKKVPKALCEREDCRVLFDLTRQDRKFCSNECARCMVMRRSREKQRRQRSNENVDL
jgi:hypothetical protein